MLFHRRPSVRMAYGFPLLIVLVIIGFELYAYYNAVFGYLVDKNMFGIMDGILAFIFFSFLILLMASYYQVIVTDPGNPAKILERGEATTSFRQISRREDHEALIENLNTSQTELASTPEGEGVETRQRPNGNANQQRTQSSVPVQTRYCQKCNAPKPVRTHHCSMCGRCITRMDHHCPWVANCIGFGNHKYFILFLFYAFLCCLIVGLQNLRIVMHAYDVSEKEGRRIFNSSSTMMGIVLSLAICISVGGLAAFHFYLVATNKTTLEMAIYGRNNPFDMGFSNNMNQIFGKNRKLWLLPVDGHDRTTDGLEYPIRDDELSAGQVNIEL